MKRMPCKELSYDVKYFGAITDVDNTDLIHEVLIKFKNYFRPKIIQRSSPFPP